MVRAGGGGMMQEEMKEEMRPELIKFMKSVAQLDPVSFMLTKNAAEVLLARDLMERERMAGNVPA